MKETLFFVPVKLTGSHIAWEALDSTRSASCSSFEEKPTGALRQKVSSPTGLFIPLHIYHKACSSLPAISLVLIPHQPRGHARNIKAPGPSHLFYVSFFFWDAEKNERLSLLTLSDEQFPDMAGNGYVSSFILYVTHWNDRRYGGEWWIRQCSKSLRAEAEL